MTAALEVFGLTRTFGARRAIDDLSLQVQAGDVYGFLGPNGAGKTTAIRCILGLIRADRGSVTVFGEADPVAQRRHVGAIVETPCFHDWMSGLDNLRQAGWYQGLSGKTLETSIERVLERVGLRERARDRARGYSLGMRQRLGIARALLGGPRILFLDEPTNGLDPEGVREMRDLIRSFALHDGVTVFISSHVLVEVQAICNRVGILKEGRMRAEGRVSDLLAGNALPRYRLQAPDPAALATVLARHEITVLAHDGDVLVVQTALSGGAINALAFEGGVVLDALQRESRNLEDVFLEVVG